MQKSRIIYENLLSLLNNIIDGTETENYYEALGSQELKDEFLLCTDNLKKEIDAIRRCKLTKTLYNNYNGLLLLINSFQEKFSNFPNLRLNEIQLIVFLSQKFCELTEDFEEEEILIGNFKIIDITYNDNCVNYFYSSNDEKKILFLINFDSTEKLKTDIHNLNLSATFILQILSLIGDVNLLPFKSYLITHKDNLSNTKDLQAIVKIHLLSEGHILHNPTSYDLPPLNKYLDDLKVGENYQQFSDIISILSEYNYQKDILDKYLRAYHILENFMFRLPLVNLETLSNGKIFRIRDFRLMYRRVEKSETDALSDLLKEALLRNDKSNKLLKKSIHDRWLSLNSDSKFDLDSINELLKSLRIEIGKKNTIAQYPNITFENIEPFFKQMIYMIRNAIVHNKETEFHLTHSNLDEAKGIVISHFLIPSIEEIIFNLMSTKNNIVWYKNSKLLLWDE